MIEQIKKSLDSFDRKGYVPEDMRLNCENWLRYLIGEVERLNGKVTYKSTIVGYSVELIEDLEKKVEELQRELAKYREEEPGPRFRMDAQGNLTLVEEG